MASLAALPLRELVRVHRALRRAFFSVPWPEGAPSVISDHSPAEVETALRRDHHFESGVTLSYRYDGEVMNLRRPEGVENGIQLQGHVRAREHEAGWEYAAHIEPDPDEHPRRHLDEVGFRWDRDWLAGVLTAAGFEVDP